MENSPVILEKPLGMSRTESAFHHPALARTSLIAKIDAERTHITG
jgi:hypothetical protein